MVKKYSVLICLLLGVFTSIQAKERVIEHPSFIAWNSDIIEIDKIVLNDTATILYTHAYYTPRYWIRISSQTFLLGNDGVKYTIQATEGIPMDKEYYMPESGETQFQMVFPPLPETVSTVDFSEGDTPESFNIWGIQLKSQKLPKLELPQSAASAKFSKKTKLTPPVFAKGAATLKGRILDYKPAMGKTLSCNIASCISVTSKTIEIDIAEDGTFQKEIPVVTVTPASSSYMSQPLRFFLAPGEETTLYINLREITRSGSRLRKAEKPEGKTAYYAGYMAGISDELTEATQSVKVQDDFWPLIMSAANKSMEELRTEYLKEKDENLARIDKLNISPASKDILRGDVILSTIEHIHFIPATFSEAYVQTNKLTESERIEFYDKPLDIPDNFFTLGYKDLTMINSPEFVYSIYYPNVVGNPFIHSRLTTATGIDKGFLFDLAKVEEIIQQINDIGPATPEQLKSVEQSAVPFLATIVEEKNEELARIIEMNKKKSGFTINELGEVTNEELFASLIAEHKGKVVLVDLWATWCGPCIMAHKEMKPMKDELQNEDIVFLYIAGENSPKQSWENMLSDISGEHYRINKEQWNYMVKTFGVRGVPTYFVVDRTGEITYKSIGFPGVEVIKKELMKQL